MRKKSCLPPCTSSQWLFSPRIFWLMEWSLQYVVEYFTVLLFTDHLLCIILSFWNRLCISRGRNISFITHYSAYLKLNNDLLAVFFFVSVFYEMSALSIFYSYTMAVFEILDPFSSWSTVHCLFCTKLETSFWLKSNRYLESEKWDVKFITFLLEIFH